MSRKRMYRKGARLTIEQVVGALQRHEYVYLNDRPMHCGFMGNQHFWTLLFMCQQGRICAAVRNENAD